MVYKFKILPGTNLLKKNDRQFLNRFQVVPLTSRVERLYPSEAYIALNDKKGKAMADQLTTVSKLRLIGKIGTLTEAEMTAIGIAIKTQLDLV